ncbi:uncharacterized protein A1O5_00791 [Cladophialophora psammophila CBS 110553]|uniref:Oxidoreductase n=1 Tax=Cladophialophora psammophila CBS 110553 TaxID=1182543 RepID=W9X7S0_9EURO|nr:uncharacterized protein A1O5_00791 [Cladophialophora psammophila CBS 110553]EXJ76283.1 hypothetical protein A1O5_00791 [Cladophialophora psammophila CBS 110553]
MEGKVIAISGGASGIGLATAKILASRGAKLSLADWNEEALKDAVKGFKSSEILTTKLDVRSSQDVDQWIAKTVEHFSRLDGAANCAGVFGKHAKNEPLAHVSNEQWDTAIGINLTGLMYCVRAELQQFEKKGTGGSIVNVASVAGLLGLPGSAAYTASKHGVVGMTRAAAKEYGPKGIRINAVAPGAIYTPLMLQSQEINNAGKEYPPFASLGRHGLPDEVANMIVFLLGPESSYASGAVFTIDGAWNC